MYKSIRSFLQGQGALHSLCSHLCHLIHPSEGDGSGTSGRPENLLCNRTVPGPHGDLAERDRTDDSGGPGAQRVQHDDAPDEEQKSSPIKEELCSCHYNRGHLIVLLLRTTQLLSHHWNSLLLLRVQPEQRQLVPLLWYLLRGPP